VDVTFNVNMKVKATEGTFNPATSNVFVRGSFNDWSTDNQMMDPDNDSIYTFVATGIGATDTLFFKFFYDNPDTWESDPNRELMLTGSNAVVTDYFDRDSVIDLTGDGFIIFSVDMSVMNTVGIWNPATDTIQVRGDFNGWSGSDVPRSVMIQNFLDENLWELNVSFTSTPLFEDRFYKFYVDVEDAATDDPNWQDGWERPVSVGGGNRGVEFLGLPNQELPKAYYDDILPEWVINAGTNLEVVFSVDMTNAMDPDTQAVPFNPATDTVYWVSEQPAFQVTQGWNEAGRIRAVPLMTQNGNVYSGTLNIQAPSFNAFEYRYAYSSGGSIIYEEAGFGSFAYSVRYAPMSGPNTFPTNPYNAPQDGWTNSPIKVNETPPLAVVNELDLTPNGYVLEQNYPNPFNPSTKIRFSVPEQGIVSLKVYNALGEEVESLINYEMAVGTYEAIFDAKNLSSGVYFYTIKAGNFTTSKKMLLMK
jgi:hypothetical protein